MPDETPQPAVMPDFADAAGLEALAAGGRSVPVTRSHGDAKAGATPPAVSPAWPPPKTPEQFKALVRQVDSIGSGVAALLLKAEVPSGPDEIVNETAEGIWPLAYFYGAGGDRPSKGVLIAYAVASVLGLVAFKIAATKAAAAERKPLEIVKE